MRFTKLQGCGNDYIYVDCFRNPPPRDPAGLSRAISDHRGHVAKFIGDGLLALFGALDLNPWQANDAAHAALAMAAALDDYNRTLAAEGLPPLRFGVGIHRGGAVAGIVGRGSRG